MSEKKPSPERYRTFQWLDPALTAGAARRASSGLEFLRSLDPARSAPVAECLDFQLTQVSEGRVAFEMTPAEFHYNPIGTVHGGVVSTLCDSAMGAAVHSTLPAGAGYTTLELKVNLLRPITAATGRLRCEGEVLSLGARTALAQARLVDGAGKLYALGTATCMIFRPEPREAGPDERAAQGAKRRDD
jgi:uncharacterized protein (TIGR00369 family)